MANVTVEDGKLRYRKLLSICELPTSELVWAYVQPEGVSDRMCCSGFGAEIGRVVVLDRDGRKETFQFESMQEARELLEKLGKANPNMAVGYTSENQNYFSTVL